MSVIGHSAKEIWTHASITEYYPSLPLPLALTFAFLTKKEAPTKRKEKWKVPLPFEDRLFLDRVRTRSLVRKLGVSFDLLPTEQLAVVETSQQLHAKRTYGHRGRRGAQLPLLTQRPARRAVACRRQGRQRDSKPVAGLYFTEYHSAVRQ